MESVEYIEIREKERREKGSNWPHKMGKEGGAPDDAGGGLDGVIAKVHPRRRA